MEAVALEPQQKTEVLVVLVVAVHQPDQEGQHLQHLLVKETQVLLAHLGLEAAAVVVLERLHQQQMEGVGFKVHPMPPLMVALGLEELQLQVIFLVEVELTQHL